MSNFAVNPSYSNGYLVNKTYYNPISFQGPQVQQPVFEGSVSKTEAAAGSKKTGCTDGKDDGNIGFFSALGHAVKGGIKFITGMFTDEKGDFSLSQTLKTAGAAALIAAATFIPVVGPFVVPALCAYGMVDGGLKIAKGFCNAMDAETDGEAKAAWENVGSGATEGFLSYTGYKASGGFSAAREAASADLATLKAPKTSTPATTAEPKVIDVDYVEVEPLQLEAPKTTTTEVVKYEAKPSTTDVVKYEPKPSTTDVVKYDPARAEAAQAEVTAQAKASAKVSNDAFTQDISGKVAGRGGINNLNAQEKAKLAEILDVSIEELSSMSKKTYRNLSQKYHIDHHQNADAVTQRTVDNIYKIVQTLYKNSPKVESAVA